MMNGECINRKIIDHMSRMALEKEDLKRFFFVLLEIGRGARCIKGENRLLMIVIDNDNNDDDDDDNDDDM